MIKPIKYARIKRKDGLFHSPKQDIEVLITVCNALIDKVDELTKEVNRLSSKE